MKLRTRGNSIRLRLEQHEIKNLVTQGAITESIAFAPNQSFKYTLAASDNGEFSSKYQNGEIRIEIPLSLAKGWSESEEEGIYQTLNPNTDFEVKLAVEKDFQCLHKRPDEDESGLFPNPKAGN